MKSGLLFYFAFLVIELRPGMAESHTQIHEHTGSNTGRAQIAVVDPDERACPTTILRIANDLGDDGDGGRSS